MQPLVYVVVLNWNGANDTIKCLRSLDCLDYDNFRVIVVDNGSTDDSVLQIRQEFPDIVVLETGNNLGFSGGNNVGIRFALEHGAEYVWLLNNDTIVDAHSLSAMVETAESDETVGAVGSVLYYMDQPDRVQAWGGGEVDFVLGRSRHHEHPVTEDRLHYITGASLLLRTAALKDVGLLDELFFMYWEDTDLAFRLRMAGWRLQVASESRVWHKVSASLGPKSRSFDLYYSSSRVLFFRKHARIPLIPILNGTILHLLRRLEQRSIVCVRPIVTGLIASMNFIFRGR